MLDADCVSSSKLQQDLTEGLCQSCLKEGRKSRLKKFQINFEECVCTCSNAKCDKIIPQSSIFLNRKASEIPKGRKKKVACPLPGTSLSDDIPSSNVTLIWSNKQLLCWLDVSLILMVTCQSLRRCLRTSSEDLELRKLCQTFDSAQLQLELINRTELSNKLNDSPGAFPEGASPLESEGPLIFGRTDEETFSNFSDPSELLRILDDSQSEFVDSQFESSSAELSLPNGDGCQTDEMELEKLNLSQPMSSLDEAREKIWEQLQPLLKCKKGDEESPVFALPVLLKKNKFVEPHFKSSFHWQFYCSKCHFVDITVETKVVISLKTLNKSLSPTSYISHRECAKCGSPRERNSLVIQKLPACPLFHFVDGLPAVESWDQLAFSQGGYNYKISAIIQYLQNPRHFVAWIKDSRRNLWLEGDDMKPVVRWSENEPKFPPSEAHIIMWERQGRCMECVERQTYLRKIGNADTESLKQMFQERKKNNNDPAIEEDMGLQTDYHKPYIPRKTKDLSQEKSHRIDGQRTHTRNSREESCNRSRRKSTEAELLSESLPESNSLHPKVNKLRKPSRRSRGNLALKFAAFSETLPTFVEYKEMMQRKQQKSNRSGGSSRSSRLGSVSPLCSPSGSSESCSLPDTNQNTIPDLDLILENYEEMLKDIPTDFDLLLESL